MILRIRRYAIILIIFVFILFIIIVWDKSQGCVWYNKDGKQEVKTSNDSRIRCVINGDTKRWIQCLKYKEDVFLPFEKFVKKQFDVSGRLIKGKFARLRIVFR